MRTILIAAAVVIAATACQPGNVQPVDVTEWFRTEADTPTDITDEAAVNIAGMLNRMYWERVWEYVDGFNQPPDVSLHPRLVCLRYRESDRGPYPHKNGYTIVSSNGLYFGAYQYLPSTWNSQARSQGYGAWAGTRPDQAPAHIQDAVTLSTLNNGGASHWGYSC